MVFRQCRLRIISVQPAIYMTLSWMNMLTVPAQPVIPSIANKVTKISFVFMLFLHVMIDSVSSYNEIDN
jgi:hypothetical protein